MDPERRGNSGGRVREGSGRRRSERSGDRVAADKGKAAPGPVAFSASLSASEQLPIFTFFN